MRDFSKSSEKLNLTFNSHPSIKTCNRIILDSVHLTKALV